MNTGQEEVRKDMSTCQDQLVPCQRELKNEISAVKAAQNEFEETITNMLDRQLKGIMSVVQQQPQSLCKVSSELQVTQQCIDAT
jgi:hypothetical protein